MDYKSLENRGCVLHIGRFRFWRPIPTAALWRAKVGWLCAVNARVMRKFAFGPDGHAHATLNDNVAGLSNANNESEELRAHWRVLRAIWVAQDDTPFTLDGPFRLNPPSQGLGRQKRRGRRQRRAGALSPAPAATAAAPPPAFAPAPPSPPVSPPFSVSLSLVTPQESHPSPAVIAAVARPIGRRRRQHREVDCAPTRGKRNRSRQATRRSVPLHHATRSSSVERQVRAYPPSGSEI